MTISILSNLRGIKSKKNRKEKMEILKKAKCHIICSQELRLTTTDDIKEVQNMWTEGKSYISIGDSKAGGVGIVFKEEVNIIKAREIFPGRSLDILYRNKKMRIINIYTPQDRSGKIKIFHRIQEVLNTGCDNYVQRV